MKLTQLTLHYAKAAEADTSYMRWLTNKWFYEPRITYLKLRDSSVMQEATMQAGGFQADPEPKFNPDADGQKYSQRAFNEWFGAGYLEDDSVCVPVFRLKALLHCAFVEGVWSENRRVMEICK